MFPKINRLTKKNDTEDLKKSCQITREEGVYELLSRVVQGVVWSFYIKTDILELLYGVY